MGKRKLNSKELTFGEHVCRRLGLPVETLKKTPRQIVMIEDETAKCVKTRRGFSIRAGRDCHGRGADEEKAWMDATLNLFGLLIYTEYAKMHGFENDPVY